MPPAAKAGCCKSDQLSSYRGHSSVPQAATGRQASGPRKSPSSKAAAQAALGDSCLQQPRQDSANLINYLLIGATGIRHRGFQAAELEGPEFIKSITTLRRRQDAASLINYLLIRRPLQSVERVRLQPSIHLLSSSQSPNSNHSIQQQLSKAQQLKAVT